MTTVRPGNRWTEVGPRVFVRRYRFFDQDIVAVLGDGGEVLVVDTRSSPAQAREILDDLRELHVGPVSVVVNTHGHGDHCNGNSVFRPAPIWGHERCATMIRLTGEAQRVSGLAETPDVAADLAEVVLDPPENTFTDRATLDLDGRIVDLAYLGRGHTDNDIVISIADADVLCVGDLLENGAPPWFGDGYPMDWPATARAILGRVGERTVVVPGHGAHGGRAFVERSIKEIGAIADLASRVHAGELGLEDAVAAAPYRPSAAREALERGVAQLRGELGD
jgi:glyoxylase-like metal-dependent hydrolase (beta-lactamase superfamily II)